MVYDLPQDSKQHFAKLKRDAQNKRAMYYIEKVDAEHVFPMAGPPMFLRDDLFRFNGWGVEDDSIFTDQRQFLTPHARRASGSEGYEFVPGTQVDLNGGTIEITQTLYTPEEIDRVFEDKWAYLAEQRDSRQAEVLAEIETRAEPMAPAEMLAALQEWWEPLLRRARTIRTGVGGNVRFRIGELDMVVDFPKAKVREYAGEECIYWYTIPADLVSTNIRDHEIDWSNSIFLSMQFAVGRSGKFNEFLTTFLKCLSRDRIEYVENGTRSSRIRPRTPRSASGRCSGAAPTCAPTSPRPARSRTAYHLRAPRLEVGPGQRAVPHRTRAPHPCISGDRDGIAQTT